MSSKILYKTCVSGDYDVEVAFLEGITTKVMSGSTNTNARKYAWVHTDVLLHPYSTRSYRSIGEEREAYKVFDAILCVSTSAKASFIKKYDFDQSIISVQPNVLDEKEIINKSKQLSPVPIKPKTIIAVGRLSKEKGFLRLISVMSRLRKDGINYSLMIVGDGKERYSIEREIYNNNLSALVTVTGFVSNPYPLIAQSDLLVSSSYAEGYGNVVAEAVILGTPVVATACGGVLDILGDSQYGFITQNTEDGLYEGLKRVLSDDQSLLHLKSMAIKRKGFFRLKNRISELDDLLLKGVNNTKRPDHE